MVAPGTELAVPTERLDAVTPAVFDRARPGKVRDLEGRPVLPSRRLELFQADFSLVDQGYKPFARVAPDFGVRVGYYPLRFFGIEGFDLVNAEDRSPIWPAGIAGSLSHCDTRAWVALVDRSAGTVGIDGEHREALKPELWRHTMLPEEIAARAGGEVPYLLFPERATLFAERAMRLRQLAGTHPMGDYLRFIAELAADAGAGRQSEAPEAARPQPAPPVLSQAAAHSSAKQTKPLGQAASSSTRPSQLSSRPLQASGGGGPPSW